MPTESKQAKVAELTELLKHSEAVYLTEYRGLPVAELKKLRRALGSEARYLVTKNTLSRIAVAQAGLQGLEENLSGPTALVLVNGDPVAAAKAVKEFAAGNEALRIKGGYFDGKALSVAAVEKLASLESRDVLLAKVAGVAKAPLSRMAYLAAAPLQQVARLAAALRDKQAA